MSAILVIEDDPKLAFLLKDSLEFEGHTATTVASGTVGLTTIIQSRPDLVILDVMLPDTNGIQVCRALRERGDTTPVILLTARSQEVEKVQGLDAGADDYVTKPFGVLEELMARVRTLLRRTLPPPERLQKYSLVGGVELDFTNYRALRGGKKLALSQKEIEILRILIEHRNEPVSREVLLKEVWKAKDRPSSRTVDVHVTHLRDKLGPSVAKKLITVHGIGYTFIDDRL